MVESLGVQSDLLMAVLMVASRAAEKVGKMVSVMVAKKVVMLVAKWGLHLVVPMDYY